jgi:tartrate-resistant acid phosphatase type 5
MDMSYISGQPSPVHHPKQVGPQSPLSTLFFSGGADEAKAPKHIPIQNIQPLLFSTIPLTPEMKRFAVLGDPGSGTKDQWAIAKQLKKEHAKQPFGSVLVMGDNVYEDGEPHLFEERLYKPYQSLYEKGVRFFPVLGNHDVRKGYGDMQLNYMGAPSFYSIALNKDLELFALDTTTFLPGYEECYDKDPMLAQKKTEIQLQWLEKALSESKAKFKIVFGHYPLYSSGDKSEKATWEKKLANDAIAKEKMKKTLEPLLQKHQVDLYLSAHEHHYERSNPINGILHIITGAAGKLKDIAKPTNPDHSRATALKEFHFMVFELTDAGITFKAVNKKGKTIDNGLLTKQPTPLQQLA